ncbi:hypothetical protein ASG39_21625 [Rhizobium sp. Leaf371]|uniref:hypothetical protein n=1 Tax=Rhizobium sp. Leaf371 TaxID=1736355 RepID=UPI000715AF37|nr:hypothetical protein [Rhizobium sp. Leaf371]KQS71438.1 hypothetical protein ASG39_21625 [Rhizobium sp. Leaf371]
MERALYLVDETGQALSRIVEHGTDVRKLVFAISSAAREQSTGIGDVSQAVQSVERIMQHDAAIVEENNAEIYGLCQRVEILTDKIDRFRIETAPVLENIRRVSAS